MNKLAMTETNILIGVGSVLLIIVGLVFLLVSWETPKDPEWPIHVARTWALDMKVEPTALRCEKWNNTYARCDLATNNGIIYPLDCYSRSGCTLERK